jgi:hypothetical protein
VKTLWLDFMMTFVLSPALSLAFSLPQAHAATSGELFGKGKETFLISNNLKKPVRFRLLEDSITKQAVALAIIATVNAQPDVKPKLPTQSYIDARVESLTLIPKGDRLNLLARVSGHDLEIPGSINRKEFLDGKTVKVVFPPQTKTVATFDLDFKGGELRMKLDKPKNELVIEDARGKLEFQGPLGGEETEKVQFSGRGIRQ